MMEKDMEDFVEGENYGSEDEWEIDSDYEFDAATFFDFSRLERRVEIQEAEEWFDFADSYASSPIIVKLNLKKIFAPKQQCSSLKSEDVGNVNSTSSNNSDVGIVKTKKTVKSRSSTLMKPTLSLLAKQDKLQDVHLRHLIDRPKQSLAKLDQKSLLSPSRNLATKRQKLECGYLMKMAQLKHPTLLLHKIVKKGGPLGTSSQQHSKLKVTVPKEPQLETMQRAQRRRSKIASESSEDAKLKVNKFNSRRLNGKIHDANPKLSTQKLPENPVAKLKNMERDMQHSSLDGSSLSSDEILSQNLPIESFSKLSIKSENGSNSVSQTTLKKYTMGLKENSQASFQLDFWRCAGKPNQCGGDKMNLEIGHNHNVSRSLDIH